MIEAKLEKIFVERLKAELDGMGIQVCGTWDVASLDDVKAEEDEDAVGVLVVKTSPRQYRTPTVPDATINGGISLTVRGDVDYNGQVYLNAVQKIMREMERLQKCWHDAHQIYSMPEEGWTVTGFQLTQGDNTLNPTTKVWNYTHSFVVYGVIDEQFS